jgi:hypothetical protein
MKCYTRLLVGIISLALPCKAKGTHQFSHTLASAISATKMLKTISKAEFEEHLAKCIEHITHLENESKKLTIISKEHNIPLLSFSLGELEQEFYKIITYYAQNYN